MRTGRKAGLAGGRMVPGDNRESDKAVRPRLFLSYTRADIESARPIIAMLEDAGFDVWWDGLIEGGDHYLPTTEAALEGADCVVVLWSRRAVDSNWVRDEAQSGRERGRLVPVSLDGTMSPLGFRQIQLIDISGWNGNADAPEMSRIVTAIHRLIDPATGTASPQPAIPAQPAARQGGTSRRGLMIGGAGLAAAAAGLGTWQFGLFEGAGDSGAAMSMAVLRFANLTGDDEQSWFSDGLSNELRQALARNPRLRVSAPTSSRGIADEDDFEIARALGVGTILRGGVQRAAETVRIFAELVEVEDGLVRWSESYDRSFDDVLAVQSEIAETVALALVAEIAGQEGARLSLQDQMGVGGTDNVEAYEAYLRGIAISDLSAGVESDRSALLKFEEALGLDPQFADAHAMRATMFAAIANATSDADEISSLYDQSIAVAKRAIALEPALSRGHLALGFALNNGRLDRKGALPHYQRADELAPGDADTQGSVALFYAYGDQQARAVEIAEQTLVLDPLNARAFRRTAFVTLLARQYARTIVHCEKALELNPNLASVNYALGTARLMRKDTSGAIAAYDAEIVPLFSQVGLAIAYAEAGKRSAAQASFDTMIDQYGDAGLYQQAQVHAQWGDSEQALATLARAFEVRDPGVLFAPNDPLLDPLRGEAELERLLLQLSA
ncbi:MAG: TIR domain-containing protein [Erythrobacter sp.]